SSGVGGRDWYLHATGGCKDTSDVVGLRRCTRFAAWAKNLEYPQLILEGGALVRRFPSLLGSQIGSVTHGVESFSYRMIQPASVHRFDTALLASVRVSIGLSRAVYGGLEVDLGGITRPGPAAEMASTGVFGSPDVQPGHGLLVDSLGVVGVRAATGFGALGVELAGGLRAVSYSFHSSYHDCQQSTSVNALAAVGEARARGELWLGPWLTAGVTLGTSVLERNAWMGGVYLGVHSRAFGGNR
ncbi:MAG TPA: hypothetical protein VF516_28010, partial [Kofleriaceae bacterium]